VVNSDPVVTGTAPPRGIDRIGALSGAPLRRSSGISQIALPHSLSTEAEHLAVP
jgi:hypothetical protein